MDSHYKYPTTLDYLKAAEENRLNGTCPIFISRNRLRGDSHITTYSVVAGESLPMERRDLKIQVYGAEGACGEPVTITKEGHLEDRCVREIHL